jgi:hypothetical protein
MYHDRIDIGAARRVIDDGQAAITAIGGRAWAMAALVVVALPFLAIGMLVRMFWRDLTAIVRALVVCFKTYAEEFARRP